MVSPYGALSCDIKTLFFFELDYRGIVVVPIMLLLQINWLINLRAIRDFIGCVLGFLDLVSKLSAELYYRIGNYALPIYST